MRLLDADSAAAPGGVPITWYAGVLLGLAGVVIQNFGTNLMRFSHLRNQAKPENEQTSAIRQPFWLLGIALLIGGNIIQFAGLALAPQSIIAPLASLELLSNALFAHFFLKERMTRRDLIATLIVIVGAILVVAFGSREDDTSDLPTLLGQFKSIPVITYLVIVGILVIALLSGSVYLHRAKAHFDKKKYDIAYKVLAVTYPVSNGLLASLTTLFSKSTGVLITTSIEGNNQFTQPLTYMFMGVFLFTAIGQVVCMNQWVQSYDATFAVPVSYATWVAFAITGGALYFDEFSNFTRLQYGMYFFGVATVLAGVATLAVRIAKGEMSTSTRGSNPNLADAEAGADSGEQELIERRENDVEVTVECTERVSSDSEGSAEQSSTTVIG